MHSINKNILKAFYTLFFIAIPASSLAHHSTAAFGNNGSSGIELEGRLVQLNWRNPHPSMLLQISETNELWQIQIPGTINTLVQAGITENSFKLDQVITVTGLASGQIKNYLHGSGMQYQDGNLISFNNALQSSENSTNQKLTDITSSSPLVEESLLSNTNYLPFFISLACLLCCLFLFAQKQKLLLVKNKIQSEK